MLEFEAISMVVIIKIIKHTSFEIINIFGKL